MGYFIIVQRNVLHVLCIPCVILIVKILYLPKCKKSEGKDIDPSISAEIKMVLMSVQARIQGNAATEKFRSSQAKKAVIVKCFKGHYFGRILKKNTRITVQYHA